MTIGSNKESNKETEGDDRNIKKAVALFMSERTEDSDA